MEMLKLCFGTGEEAGDGEAVNKNLKPATKKNVVTLMRALKAKGKS